MASKRCYSIEITEGDDFLDLSFAAQCLYFHLCQNADDDGFVSGQKRVMRYTGTTADELKELIDSGFVIPFPDCVVISDWHVHNSSMNHYHASTRPERALLTDSRQNKNRYLLKSSETQQNQHGNQLGTHMETIDTEVVTELNVIECNITECNLTEMNESKQNESKQKQTECKKDRPNGNITPDEDNQLNVIYEDIISRYPSNKVNFNDIDKFKDYVLSSGQSDIVVFATRVKDAIYLYLEDTPNTTFVCVLGNLFVKDAAMMKLKHYLSKVSEPTVLSNGSIETNDYKCLSLEKINDLTYWIDYGVSPDYYSSFLNADSIPGEYYDRIKTAYDLYPVKKYSLEDYFKVFQTFVAENESNYEEPNYDISEDLDYLIYEIKEYVKYLEKNNLKCNVDLSHFMVYRPYFEHDDSDNESDRQ